MTNYQLPLTGGALPTGNVTSDERGDVLLAKQVRLTFAAPTVGRTLPPDVKLHRALVVNTQAVSGSGFTSGVLVRIGTTANPNKYGSIPVSAVGTYEMALSAACISAGGQVVFDATAQATAADWEEFGADVQLVYFAKTV